MKKLTRTATLSAILIAVFSVPMGFVTHANAGGGPADLDLILLANCAFVHDLGNPASLGSVTPPASAVLNFNIQNDGTATATVDADIGNSAAGGGFQDDIDGNLSIFPSDTTIDAADTATDVVPAAALDDAGTPVQFAASLEPLGSPNDPVVRPVTYTVDTDNIQNQPKSGTQSATLTFTVACA